MNKYSTNHMRENISQLQENINRLKKSPNDECSVLLFRETVALSAEIPQSLPQWFEAGKIARFEELENMFSDLPNSIKSMYTIDKSAAFIFTPDLFIANTGYNVVNGVFPCSLWTKRIRETREPMRKKIMFVPADVNSPCVAAGLSDCILLCPGRFNSNQLAWISSSFTMLDNVLLLDPDHMKNLHDEVRANDTHAIAILLARWEVEREAEIKTKLMMETLEHIAVIVEGAL